MLLVEDNAMLDAILAGRTAEEAFPTLKRFVLMAPGSEADESKRAITWQQGCYSIDILKFGCKTVLKSGPGSGPNSVQVKTCLKTPNMTWAMFWAEINVY